MPTNPDLEAIMANLERLPLRRRGKTGRMQGYPRFLYKFRAVDPNEPASVSRLRDLIVLSHLWLSHHERFNDPFDLKAHVVFEGSERDKESRLKTLIGNYSPTPRKERRQVLREWMARPRAETERLLNTAFRQQADRIGIVSFAGSVRSPRSTLMWAHYAKSHEGVCLQFEFARDTRTFGFAQKVKYETKYPLVNWVDPKKMGDNLYAALTTKHADWAYEEEWRILHLMGADSYLPFKPDSLASVIVGCQSPQTLRSAVEALLVERKKAGLPAIRLYRAEQHPREYGLVMKPVPTP